MHTIPMRQKQWVLSLSLPLQNDAKENSSPTPAKNKLLGLEDDQKAIHIMTDFSSQDF